MNDLQNLHKKPELDISLSLDALTSLIQQAEATWQLMLPVTMARNPLVRLKHAFLAKVGLVTGDRYQQQAEFNASVIKICYWLSTTMHQLQHVLNTLQAQLQESSAIHFRTRSMLQTITDSQQEVHATIKEILATQQQMQAELQQLQARVEQTTIKEILATQQQMQAELQQLQARVEQIQGRVVDHALAQTLFAEQIHALQQVNSVDPNKL